MEVNQNFSAIKLEPIEITIKSETGDELLVGITNQSIADDQEFEDATEPVLCSGVIKTEPTEIKSEPKDEPLFEFTAQDVVGGAQKFKEESDNDSQSEGPPKEPEMQAGESQSESVDLFTLYQAKIRKMIEEKGLKDRSRVRPVNPSEYTILESKRVQCNHCGKSKESLFKIQRHIRGMHRDKLYKCPFCPFTSKHRVSYHIISKHKSDNDIKYSVCPTCGRKFKFKKQLSRHVKSHMTAEELMQTNEMYTCEQCPTMFCYKESWIKHRKSHHNKNNENASKLQYHSMNHIQKKQPETLNCPECDFTTQIKEDLKEHKHRDHWRSYKCPKCPYETYQRATLSVHERTHEILQQEDKNFKLDCGTTSLKNHTQTHPNPEEIRYFYCYHCCFKFKRKYNLRIHIRRHFEREEVEFECHICDFKTKKRQNYSCHIDEHNNKKQKS